MAWFPGAIRKEVTRHRTPMARYDGVCNHIAVSNGASLFNYFNQPGNATSHFYIRKGSATSGATMADFEQYVDTRYRAPANLEGNHRLISIETQGGVGDDLDAGWNALQLERLAWILAQCHRLHGIPLIAMPNSLPTTRGLGYHRLGVDPWRADGGEKWSKSYGKVCPGSARIAQQGLVIARARQIVARTPPEDEVTPDDIEAIAAAVWRHRVPEGAADQSVGTIMTRVNPGPAGLVGAVRDSVWDKGATSALDGVATTTLNLLRYSQADARRAAGLTVDVNALAAAIVAKLPAEQPIDQATVEAGVRAVLGSLD